RMHGWRPTCTATYGRRLKRPVRYFTFCAASAIDVFMLERAGILRRDGEMRLVSTFFCERDPADFAEISRLIGSAEQGFQGAFEEIILFTESDSTRGLSYQDIEGPRRSPFLQERLRVKDIHYRLKATFPFDILNIDATGTLLPPKQGAMSRLLRAI